MNENYQIRTLLSGYKWDTKNSNTITFSFFSDGSYYGSENVSPVSEATKNKIRYILLEIIQPLINLNFVEVQDSETSYGQIRYMLSDGPLKAYTYAPNYSRESDIGGDVHLNPNFYNQYETDELQVNFGFHALLHETLHALGLKHPGNYDGDGGDPGFPPFLPGQEDNLFNTVMTYNFYPPDPLALTPMPYDILALQYLYGAGDANSGNTIYTFNTVYGYSDGSVYKGSTTAPLKMTIFDSGGIDTLNLSELSADNSYYFDLREGGVITTSNAYNGAAYQVFNSSSNETYYATTFGTAIAYNTTIENAIATQGDDYIIGNDAANNFNGGAGNDYLVGGAGDDILDGNVGYDTVNYEDAKVAVTVNLQTGTAFDGLRGKDSVFNIEAVIGSKFNDTFIGGAGNENLSGGEGHDTLMGNAGNDTLTGGDGHDLLTGGSDADVFVFNYLSERTDTIADFSHASGDKIQINSLTFGVGATLANLDLFSYNSITGALKFSGTQFAQLNNDSGFVIASDIQLI